MFAAALGYTYVFLINYLIPFIFAIGLIMMLYASINYFIIGPGEEPKREEGRIGLLWSFLFFLIGIGIYALIALFMWLGQTVTNIGSGVETGETIRLQQVPDVPRTND